MVEFNHAVKEPNEVEKLIIPEGSLDPFIPFLDDFYLPIVEDFSGFNCIQDWIMETGSIEMPIEENQSLDGSDLKKVELAYSGEPVQIPVEEIHEETYSRNQFEDGVDERTAQGDLSEKAEDMDSLIEERMEKVSLIGAPDGSLLGEHDPISVNRESNECLLEASVTLDALDKKELGGPAKAFGTVTQEDKLELSSDKDSKNSFATGLVTTEDISGKSGKENVELVSDGEDSDSSESESDSSSSSSSSFSSSEEENDDEEEEDEDEEDEETKMVEFEEGEIKNLDGEYIVDGSDDDGEGVITGPIKSKNELEFLPEVPPVNVTLEPHHQILSVGVILSILGTKVVVEGTERHNPLNEGSILWITETRMPLGIVDEIFGPVKNPYYIVRYNSDKEVPSGISQGTPVSFVPEFANHVLNDKNLYKKGYDASGENDEEVSGEAEFSDDEKEAEYKRMQRMAKRGADDRKCKNWEFADKKKFQHKGEARKNVRPPIHPPASESRPQIPNQLHTPHVAAPFSCGSCVCSPGAGPGNGSLPVIVPPGPQMVQTACYTPQHLSIPSSGLWTNGIPCQQQLNGFPMNGMPIHQHPQQMLISFPNGLPVQQQIDPSQMLLPNVSFPFGQPNPLAGPTSTSWPGVVGQNGFSQVPFGIGLQGQCLQSSMSVGDQRIPSSNSCAEQGYGPAATQGNITTPLQFNQGSTSSHGRKPYRRGGGGGYFRGGRGQRRSG